LRREILNPEDIITVTKNLLNFYRKLRRFGEGDKRELESVVRSIEHSLEQNKYTLEQIGTTEEELEKFRKICAN
jgi:hypothetical protein